MSAKTAGLELAALRAYLNRELAGPVGELSATRIDGGRSNLTYDVTDGTREWVVRRPPLGHVLATAHDMAREFRVMSALWPTAVPVPRTLALCQDGAVIGAPFYVMQKVDGTVYRTAEQATQLGRVRARALSIAFVDILADLHSVDPQDVGLTDFGRPAGFLDRQLRRWRAQLDASRSRPLPGIDELHDRLAQRIPEPAHASALLHGDYRLDNVLVGEGDRITAVVDWEMATLGDPLTDLGLLLAYWDGLAELPGSGLTSPGSTSPGLTSPGSTSPGLTSPVQPAAGFPPGAELVERYAARRGVDTSRLPWYVSLGFFKIAVILEGIHYRYAAGQTVGDGFDHIGDLVPALVALGHQSLEEA